MAPQTDPIEPNDLTSVAISAEGIDLTLIRAFLALSPAERLQAVEDRQNDLAQIAAYRRHNRAREEERGR